ncbi:MAG: N-acetyl-gamma-glutamyl-phosphate reductase [Anaerovoracaceae bacterium]|jgi:N-acetyl-gamma-glutamyl-phosphate reductase|nr:N-acetyl-gamma-glutamyl-phosphate reductase [Anaerovoracaceae bacterium]
MKKYRIFIDGSNGTTGLEIRKRLLNRDDIDLINLQEEERKDLFARKDLVVNSDLSILCLPEEASRELVIEVKGQGRILDASSGHRTNPNWVYGLPELVSGQRQKIGSSSRVCIPGCHASGFILMVRPLIEKQVLNPQNILSCFSLTGYSGGGKSMIKDYEEMKDSSLESPGLYGLDQNHKHLPEMRIMAKLENSPVFIPIVANYYRGMVVTLPLQAKLGNGDLSKEELLNTYKEYYKDEPLIEIKECEKFNIYGNEKAGKDGLCIYVYGSQDNPLVSAVFDNLGKGASGAGVQCMNLMLGIKEMTGLFIE